MRARPGPRQRRSLSMPKRVASTGSPNTSRGSPTNPESRQIPLLLYSRLTLDDDARDIDRPRLPDAVRPVDGLLLHVHVPPQVHQLRAQEGGKNRGSSGRWHQGSSWLMDQAAPCGISLAAFGSPVHSVASLSCLPFMFPFPPPFLPCSSPPRGWQTPGSLPAKRP